MYFNNSLYCTYVRPILEFATPAWSHVKGNINHVESVLRYFIGRLFDRRGMEYMDRLDLLWLACLTVHRIKADLILHCIVVQM